MKKVMAIIISISILSVGIPSFVYAARKTPEVSLDEFANQYTEMQKAYGGELVSEIVFEEKSEFYHLNGELMPLCDENGNELSFEVSKDSVELPKTVLDENSAEVEASEKPAKTSSDAVVDEDYAESIGYELEIDDDKAVLTQPYQTHRLIVKSKYDINPLDSIAVVEGYNDLHIVQFDDLKSTQNALEYYEKQRNIEYAEPDSVVSTLEYEEEEPYENSNLNRGVTYANHLSWGSESIGVDDYIDYLGDVETLPEIIVGIIDTGIELEHEFLKDRILRTNFNVSDSGDSDSENDDYGHGTHVAGIVVDNTTENVKIKGYKVLNKFGSATTEDVCLGIDRAVLDGVNVINMSLGGPGQSFTMMQSVSDAIFHGITVCVSAGNSAWNAEDFHPAGIESCITVGAIDENDVKPLWSNWGDVVDVVAPGVDIYSSYLDNTYKSLSGTSMASPFAAAASALILSRNPNMKCHEVCDYLERNGRAWWSESKPFEELLYGVPAIYIGNLSNDELIRTPAPQFSVDGGRYSYGITVELSCEDENARIYYTLDRTRATENNGILYTEPINIDKVTRIHAVAYSEGKLKSLQSIVDYFIMSLDPEENFEIDSKGIITAYNGNNSYLIIPDEINGITVRGIGKYVFNKSSVKETLTMIRLPKTVTTIADYAFWGCTELISVEGGNIHEVGRMGFCCHNIAHIDISELETVGEHAFAQNEGLTELINDRITHINRSSFYGMDNLIYVELPAVQTIGIWGLNHLMNAETILLPNVRVLGREALASCRALKTLDLPMLVSLDSSGQQFRGMVNLEEISMPNLTGAVPKQAFYLDYSLKNIDISGATSVEEEAFAKCMGLTSITLGNELTSIGKNAFQDCPNITDVYYDGTIAEWNNIQVEKGNDYLKSATIHCSLDITALLAAISQAKSCSKAEYTKESLEDLYAFADSFIELANSHAEQSEYDAAVTAILDAIGQLDSLLNYSISTFNGTEIVLTNKEGKTTSLTFAEFLNEKCTSLDVVEDGIINAKDYAYILKNYSQ